MSKFESFHQKLHIWYQAHGRHHLPWRQTADPYAIWVSEIMLQQTQVQTVLERYYFPFLKKFPTIKALADADLQEVVKAWQGLGYYNRARNLHRAAQLCGSDGLPHNIEALRELPGIGRNTAHAVAAFAFHQPVAVMEANLKRVLSRIFALEKPDDTILWQRAAELLDREHPFDYNQAMMDVGSMLCTPDAPKCLFCPANEICIGKVKPQAYPQPKMKKAVPLREQKIVLFTDAAGRIFMQPRNGNFLHGIWAFPEYENALEQAEFNGISYPFNTMQKLGLVAHAYTHFQLKAKVYQQMVEMTFTPEEGKTPHEIEQLPLSRIESKILKLLR